MKKLALLLLIAIVVLTTVVSFNQPKWVQFAVVEGKGTSGIKPVPIYFDANSIKTSDLGEDVKLVTVKMKCSQLAVSRGYSPNNPNVADQSFREKAVDSASSESIILHYPTMSYARYKDMIYAQPQSVKRGSTGFQNIQPGSVIESLYLALIDKGYVVMNTKVAKGRKQIVYPPAN